MLQVIHSSLKNCDKFSKNIFEQFYSHKKRVMKALEVLAQSDVEFSKRNPKQKASNIVSQIIFPHFFVSDLVYFS